MQNRLDKRNEAIEKNRRKINQTQDYDLRIDKERLISNCGMPMRITKALNKTSI